MRTILVTMVLAIAAGGQIAGPVEVNGVKLGSALAEWQSGPGAACSAMPGRKPSVVRFMCRNATYAGIAVNELVSFYDGHLESFLIMIPRTSSKSMRDALIQKYGQPTKKDHVNVAGPQGPVKGDLTEWSDDRTAINLNEAGGMGPTAMLTFFDRAIAKAEVTGAKLSDTDAATDNAQPAAQSAAATDAQPITSTQPAQLFDVKGVKLGSALAEWRLGPGSRCSVAPSNQAGLERFTCVDVTYAGVPVEQTVAFYQGRLQAFHMNAPHSSLITLRDALTAKFGPPTLTESKTFAIEQGTLEGTSLEWRNDLNLISLDEFDLDSSHCKLNFMHTELTNQYLDGYKSASGSSNASAQPATSALPYEVKGVKLGTPLAQWRKGPGAACRELKGSDPKESEFECAHQTYAGVPAEETVTFVDGQLDSFYLRFSHDDFMAMHDALAGKFGATKGGSEATSTASGHALDGTSYVWSNGVTGITLREFEEDTRHSVLIFVNLAQDPKAKTKTKARDDM